MTTCWNYLSVLWVCVCVCEEQWCGKNYFCRNTLQHPKKNMYFSSTIWHWVFLTVMCACVLSHFNCIQLFTPLWTVAHQAPLSMGLSRQEYWSGLPCPPPGDLPSPGIKPTSLISLALAGGLFSTSATWEAPYPYNSFYICQIHVCKSLILMVQ